ncbi:hypothetical protein CA234_11155 [Sphingomonas sp. ABOLE]|uniref:OmpA family protein n=1 Tax=Sphingomonas sp. ABOLE TaxID=1985878 RepID=UPI000F7E2435|nr:OmpA family protein [Sphingomonas sp. ABOLE]RSV40658.1 hypothetical protein CA234_11155 [Sphingomonas sp. ABOLE]
MADKNPIETMTPGQVLTDASVSEFIKAMGLSIAEAQKALDLNSIAQMEEYAKPRPGLGNPGGKSLMQLGLSPPFYHYQHADLTVSLQLTMKIGDSEALGVNVTGEIGNKGSGAGGAASARTAQITMKSLPASVTVDGTKLDAAGPDIDTAAQALADKLRAPAGKFEQAFVSSKDSKVKAELDPASAKNPLLAENAVVFLPTAASSTGIIRITNTPAAKETFQLAPSVSTEVTPESSRLLYARKVAKQIDDLADFKARLAFDPNPNGTIDSQSDFQPFIFALFDTDKDVIKNDAAIALRDGARIIKESGQSVDVVGYADTQGKNDHNLDLAKRRATNVAEFLKKNGVGADKIKSVKHFGEEPWSKTPNPDNNQHFRRAEVHFDGNKDLLIIVENQGSVQLQATPTPDKTGGGDGNGFIIVKKFDAAPVDGKKVLLGDAKTPVDIKGDAVNTADDKFAADTPEASAFNLAKSINDSSATHGTRATRKGSVVLLASVNDAVTIDLVTLSTDSIKLAADGGATISKPLSDIATGKPAADGSGSGKITFAVGATVDYRTSRQFEQSANGNSSISARLVAIPAPVEFLQEIKKFLAPETPAPAPAPAP